MSKTGENTNQNDLSNADEQETDETCTLSEILQQQREMEEDAAAVLGGSDSNYCTYNKGYIKRQALYACLTCVPESKTDEKKRAGVCLACSYKCHEGHDMVELYTKRNFRCDCGTSKILSIRCKLDPLKMEDNESNTYNQNFAGVYCTCQRPYPDPEDTVDDEMIQCILCEDWYHFRHLESTVPEVNTFEEMICSACTKRTQFLQYYGQESIIASESLNVTANETDQSMIDVENDSALSTSKLDESRDDLLPIPIDNKNDDEVEERPVAEKAVEEKIIEEKAIEEKAIKENPLEVKPIEVKPIEVKPIEENTIENNHVEGEAIEKKIVETSNKNLTDGSEIINAESKTEIESNKQLELNGATETSNKNPTDVSNIINDESKTEIETNKQLDSNAASEAKDCTREEEILNAELNQCIREIIEINKSVVNEEGEDDAQPPRKKIKLNDGETASTSTAKNVCTKPKHIVKPLVGSTFWPSNWRKILCKCTDCLEMYKKSNVEYIVDLEDTVLFYQNKGISKMEQESSSNMDAEMRALNRLDHVGRIEVVRGYNKLKENLTEFLKTFIGSQRVVTVKDINGFFQKMKDDKDKRGN